MIRIRREAYPTRIVFPDLIQRFHCLAARGRRGRVPHLSRLLSSDREARQACLKICRTALQPGDFQLGYTKVFLR